MVLEAVRLAIDGFARPGPLIRVPLRRRRRARTALRMPASAARRLRACRGGDVSETAARAEAGSGHARCLNWCVSKSGKTEHQTAAHQMLGAGPPGPWQTLSKSSIRFGPSCPRLPAQWRPMPARKNTTTKADGGQLVGYAPCLHPPAGPRAATRRACSRPLAVVVSIASRSEWKATCRCSSAAITSDQRPPREVHRRKEGRRAGDARPRRLSMAQIARALGVGRTTLFDHLDLPPLDGIPREQVDAERGDSRVMSGERAGKKVPEVRGDGTNPRAERRTCQLSALAGRFPGRGQARSTYRRGSVLVVVRSGRVTVGTRRLLLGDSASTMTPGLRAHSCPMRARDPALRARPRALAVSPRVVRFAQDPASAAERVEHALARRTAASHADRRPRPERTSAISNSECARTVRRRWCCSPRA
jgi:hypothetical protein